MSYIFTLELDEVRIIYSGLGELRARHSHELLNRIQGQVNAQDAAEKDKKKKECKKKTKKGGE